MKINIAADFSDVPIGRYPTDNVYCGENFRENYLVPALRKLASGEKVVVDFDGCEGFGSSFLDESFGRIVRLGYFTEEDLRNKLQIVTTRSAFQMYVEIVWEYIAESKYNTEELGVVHT